MWQGSLGDRRAAFWPLAEAQNWRQRCPRVRRWRPLLWRRRLLSIVLYYLIGLFALLPLRMSVYLTLTSLGLTLVMCLISAVLAVKRVIQADPAELF